MHNKIELKKYEENLPGEYDNLISDKHQLIFIDAEFAVTNLINYYKIFKNSDHRIYVISNSSILYQMYHTNKFMKSKNCIEHLIYYKNKNKDYNTCEHIFIYVDSFMIKRSPQTLVFSGHDNSFIRNGNVIKYILSKYAADTFQFYSDDPSAYLSIALRDSGYDYTGYFNDAECLREAEKSLAQRQIPGIQMNILE